MSADLDVEFARLLDRCVKAEAELVAAVLADPVALVPVAEDAGLQLDHFTQHDLRLIYDAARLARSHGVEQVLRLAKRGLQHFEYWDPRGPIGGTGCRWSDEQLAHLAARMFPCAAYVELVAAEVIDLSDRLRECTDLSQRLADLLSGAGRPRPSAPQGKIILLPLSRRKGVA